MNISSHDGAYAATDSPPGATTSSTTSARKKEETNVAFILLLFLSFVLFATKALSLTRARGCVYPDEILRIFGSKKEAWFQVLWREENGLLGQALSREKKTPNRHPPPKSRFLKGA